MLISDLVDVLNRSMLTLDWGFLWMGTAKGKGKVLFDIFEAVKGRHLIHG